MSVNFKLINLMLMNLKLINLMSMNLKLINLMSVNFKLTNLKLVVFVYFLVLFGAFWCLAFFLFFFVLVKSYRKKKIKTFKTDLVTSFILLLTILWRFRQCNFRIFCCRTTMMTDNFSQPHPPLSHHKSFLRP